MAGKAIKAVVWEETFTRVKSLNLGVNFKAWTLGQKGLC